MQKSRREKGTEIEKKYDVVTLELLKGSLKSANGTTYM